MSRRAIVILCLGAAVLLAVVALKVFEWREVEEPLPPSIEAQTNSLLAFERFLDEFEVEVESRTVLGELPDPVEATTLIFTFSGFNRVDRAVDAKRLERWVAAGGHAWLVLDPDASAAAFTTDVEEAIELETRDALLEAFDLDWCETGEDSFASYPRFDGEGYHSRFEGGVAVDVSRDWWLDEVGFLAEVDHGEGSLVVAGTGVWLSNEELGEVEHARLAWDLLRRERRPERVVIVRHRARASLFAWLRGPGFSLAVVLLLAVAFLIARRGMRLGPKLPELGRQRRDYAEHLQATGAFLWRRGDRTKLLERLRAAAGPDAPEHSAEREIWLDRVSERSGIPRAQLKRAWEGPVDAARFPDIVRTLALQSRGGQASSSDFSR